MFFTGGVPTCTREVAAGQVGFQLAQHWPVMMQDPGVGSWRRVAAGLHSPCSQGLPRAAVPVGCACSRSGGFLQLCLEAEKSASKSRVLSV